MRTIRTTSLLTALCAAFLLAGCAGFGDVFGNDRDPNDRYDDRYDRTTADVRGTVERVDTSARRIVVERDDTYRSDLRNSGSYGDGDEVAVYYDDATRVRYQGQSFRPEDLEAGDRIQADVDEVDGRLVAEDIDVIHDVTSSGSYRDDDDFRDNDLGSEDLRGTVRYVDTRDRMLEIEAARYGSSFNTGTTGSSNVVRVYYDASTVVEYQGRRYGPENLERGDVVELELRETGGRLLAEEIKVVREGALTGR